MAKATIDKSPRFCLTVTRVVFQSHNHSKGEAMSTSEENTQKLNWTTFVTKLALILTITTVVVLCFSIYLIKKEFQEKHYPSFALAKAQLQALAEHGCKVPFEDCLRPSKAKLRVQNAMDRENIAFAHGMTQVELDQLEIHAEVQIAFQKFNYLKAIGGVKRPSDLKLLEEVCRQVYYYEQKLLPNHPTDSELKQLRPPGVMKVNFCLWDHN